jgi:TonB family protein
VSYKILLIDHDESRVERIQRPLAEAGYDVVVASAAEEGLQTFERVRPDLTVIEAMLPEKTGSQLCQEIKDNPLGKEMPVILVLEAGENQQERARELDLHGCDMLIDDAIPDDDLLSVLSQFLTEKKEQVEQAAEQPTETEEPAQSDMLLDSYELDSALQKLDTILDEEQSTEEVQAEAPLDEDKVREAQQAGDFSAIAEEMGGAEEKPAEQADAQSQHEAVIAKAGLLADAGDDIDDRLDSIFSMGEAKPVEAEPEAPVKFYEEIEEETADAEEMAAPPVAETEPEEEPEMVAEPAVEEAVVEEPTEDLVEPSLEIAAQEPVVEEVAEPEAVAEPVVAPVKRAPRPAPVFEPVKKRGGAKKWWLAAAAVIVISIAAGAVMLLTGDSAPEPIAVTPPPAEGTPAEDGDLVASAALIESPVPEVEEIEAAPPAPEPQPVAKKPAVEKKPEPAPVKVATVAKPKPKPKPEPVKAAPKPEPKIETVKPAPAAVAPKPKPKPEPVKAAPKPEPKPEPEPVKPEPKPETVKTAPAAVEPKPEPEPESVKTAPAPAPVVFEPPQLVDRTDPVYPRKALKKGAGRSIVLKLLISESGRIIRVSVEQGVPVPELEAACINAVLRWRYRPAQENGVAVKAWTTAEFSF